LTQTDPGSLSQYGFDGPSAQEDEERDEVRKEMEFAASEARLEILAREEASDDVRKEMERLGMISP
jgi:hypothetical protein